ncbi:MAG: threonine/serine dehydratase [Gammaproteobacteria bacterium]|nr:threonine/serine dehydratase [Gammaproteobacteria bacterium]
MNSAAPNINEIRKLRDLLQNQLVHTPMLQCAALEAELGHGTRVTAKLEFLQRTGTFKARGALATLQGLTATERSAGVTAVSAGNHAIATAFAAEATGVSAKVVMMRAANPARIQTCRDYGAEVVFAADVHEAFALAQTIQDEEGRYFVHPFDGPSIALGAGTAGLEICEQVSDFDALLVPVGGGGLIAGVSNAVKQLRPAVQIIGVEPEGADSMHRSFAAGEPESIDKVRTIADSLGAPFALPYSFALTRANVDRLAMINDADLRRTMRWLYREMQLAVEPACAATAAALLGPLRDSMRGKHVVIVMCGSNTDWQTFKQQAEFDDLD